MLNRDRVIKGMSHHRLCSCEIDGTMCPYWGIKDCSKSMLTDAIKLLNENQTAKWLDDVATFIEGDRDGEAGHRITGETIDQFWCSWCGYPMYWKTPFCPNCGTKMIMKTNN